MGVELEAATEVRGVTLVGLGGSFGAEVGAGRVLTGAGARVVAETGAGAGVGAAAAGAYSL